MKVPTIGSVIAQGKWLQVYCSACKTVSPLDPASDIYGPKMELANLERKMPCPACQRHNQDGFHPVTIKIVDAPVVAAHQHLLHPAKPTR